LASSAAVRVQKRFICKAWKAPFMKRAPNIGLEGRRPEHREEFWRKINLKCYSDKWAKDLCARIFETIGCKLCRIHIAMIP
jgi:hypothetical protein